MQRSVEITPCHQVYLIGHLFRCLFHPAGDSFQRNCNNRIGLEPGYKLFLILGNQHILRFIMDNLIDIDIQQLIHEILHISLPHRSTALHDQYLMMPDPLHHQHIPRQPTAQTGIFRENHFTDTGKNPFHNFIDIVEIMVESLPGNLQLEVSSFTEISSRLIIEHHNQLIRDAFFH